MSSPSASTAITTSCTPSRPASPRAMRAWASSATESGTLLLLKPGRMRWDYTSPAGKLFLLDGKYAWFYAKGDPQVQRMPAEELDDLRSPLRFLLGHTELEKEMDNLTLRPRPAASSRFPASPRGRNSASTG